MLPGDATLDHAGFTVPDLDEAIGFFTEVLGCELIYRETPVEPPEGDELERTLGVHPRTRVAGALLRLGAGTTIELLEYSGPGAGGEAPPNSAHSAGHLAFHVRDVEVAAE